MADINLDYHKVRQALAEAVADMLTQRHIHQLTASESPEVRLGAGFSGRAQSLSQALRHLHETGTRRIDAYHDGLLQADQQVRSYVVVDSEGAAHLGAVH